VHNVWKLQIYVRKWEGAGDKMNEITAPNYREAECCPYCKHVDPPCSAEGNFYCNKHVKKSEMHNYRWVSMTHVCDDFDRK
jgi:hypothetical protein